MVLKNRIEVDGKFFSLADQRLLLRGVTYGTFAPRADEARFPVRDQIERDFESMRDAGFNVVRTYTEPPEDLLEIASDRELYILVGLHWSDWRYLLGASRREVRAVARSAVLEVGRAARRLAGNDNIVALCVGNEVPADVVRWVGTSRVADLVRELAETVRDEDPDRLVTYANYPSTEYLPLEHLDFLTFNVFLERRADFRRYVTRLHHLAGDRPLVLGELGVHVGPGHSGELAQAASLDWQIETALERGVAGTCVFSWTDEWHVGGAPVEGWRFGLTRRDRSARPALEVARRWNGREVADLLRAGKWPSISVVVCAYNAAETLNECLRHTCALTYRPLEIIVVDDGSTDDTSAIVSRYPDVRLLKIAHAGLGTARNVGFISARSELVAYLDADAYPSPEWLYYLALGLDSKRAAGVGGPNVSPPRDPLGATRVASAPGGPVHVLLSDDRAEHVPGCNMAFRRDVLVELGGFESVYTAAGDDVDFCWRVLDRGLEIAFHPAALVWHHRRPTARAYLRQQRGYGRAEALVASRHPDRFTGLGSARWQGRIYRSRSRPIGQQKIYRGKYGAAAFQSVYGNGGTALDLAHQVGVPAVILALAVSVPVAILLPWAFVPAGFAAVFLLGLIGVDAVHALPPTRLARRRQPWFRLAVAALSVVQPIARAWGRARHETTAMRETPSPEALFGPFEQTRGGVLVVPSRDEPRERVAAAVVGAVSRAGITVRPSTGWENSDADVLGSLVVAAGIVTVGEPTGVVQVKTSRRLRPLAAMLAITGAIAALVSLPLAVFVGAVLVTEGLRGLWRTGPGVRRAVRRSVTSETHSSVGDGASNRSIVEGCLSDDLVLAARSKNPLVLDPETESLVRGAPLPVAKPSPSDVRHQRSALGDTVAAPEASVVVAVFDNLVCTRLCLESVLVNTEGPTHELIVIDNGSSAETRGYLRRLALQDERVVLVRHATNMGFPRAVNDGMRAARGRVLVMLNNDTIVAPGWLTGLVSHLADPTVGIVGPVTNDTGDPSRVPIDYRTYGEMLAFCSQRPSDGAERDVDMVTMFCAALRRDVYENVGPLDESYGLGMFEDDDYARRIAAAGFRSVRACDVFVHHFGRATLGNLVSSGEHGRLFERNRGYFEQKWEVCWRPQEALPDSEYDLLKTRVRAAVQLSVPAGSQVAVLSRGDEELVAAAGKDAVHFPSGDDGAYAGFYPADGAEAVRLIENLRRRGCTHLIVPATAVWWMEHYPGFRTYLAETATQEGKDPGTCLVFRFQGIEQTVDELQSGIHTLFSSEGLYRET